MNFTNSISTMCLANSILLGQVGATCCAATYFIRSMTPTLATLLGKAITPQMVALGASAMSATPPIPMFSGSVLTSIKGAAIIHHDGGMMDNVDVSGHVFWVRWVRAWIAKHRHKVYMRMSTSSGNDRFGANKKVTKTRR